MANKFQPPFRRDCFLVYDARGREFVHTGLLGRRFGVDDEETAQMIVDALNNAALYRDLHRAAKYVHRRLLYKPMHDALAALDAAGVKPEEVSGEC